MAVITELFKRQVLTGKYPNGVVSGSFALYIKNITKNRVRLLLTFDSIEENTMIEYNEVEAGVGDIVRIIETPLHEIKIEFK